MATTSDDLDTLRDNLPGWALFRSDAGVFYATRRGTRLSEADIEAGLEMTVSAEDLGTFVSLLRKQQVLRESGDSLTIPRRSPSLYAAALRARVESAGWALTRSALIASAYAGHVHSPAAGTEGTDNVAEGGLLGLIDLVGKPECVREARAFVRERLGDQHPALDDVELLVSELVTNSVRHSHSRDGGTITVVLARIPDGVHAMVIDDGSDTVPTIRTDPAGEGGRGMFLVDQLAQRWGTKNDAAGRSVWFEIKH